MIRLLLLAAMAACSGPATWRPPANAETVRVDRDLVVRAESDGTVSVTARVSLDTDSATGFVRVRNGDLTRASSSEHVRLARARAWHALAAILAADPERSFRAAKRGTEEIRRFSNRGVKIAELARANNNLPEAARRMSSSLYDSLRSYVRKFHAEVW